jgi:hypothetical protein
LAARISLAATILMAAYVAIRVPAAPMARLYGGIAVLATYIIVRRIVTLVAMEYLNDGSSGAAGQGGSGAAT